jgi:hypothetical protein
MKILHPQCKVTLVKAQRRSETVPGYTAADRYRELETIDLTPFLMTEGASLTVSKSVREPAGGFSLSVPDRPHAFKTVVETLYALVEPMDYIEIRLAHEPVKGKLPIVMRGFVSQVARNEDLSSGKPQRSVTISGQDMGKIWQIIQIYYISNTVIGQFVISSLQYFMKYAVEHEAKIAPADIYVKSALTHIINPFLKKLAAIAAPKSPEALQIVNAWTPLVSVVGCVNPYTVASFQDVSLYQMMAKLLDVGPFNELYTEDREEGVFMVARPIPYKRLADNQYIQAGATTDSLDIHSEDIQSLQTARSDASVANSYWVSSQQWDMPSNLTQKEYANQFGEKGDFLLLDYLNTNETYYGYRKMEVSALLGPPDYLGSDATKAADKPDQDSKLGKFLADKRHILAELNKDAVVYESGQVTLKGNEKIKAGMYLNIRRGVAPDPVMEVYAHTVTHEFTPLTGLFRTVAQFDRGTGWAVRAKNPTPLYRSEIDAGGVIKAVK